MIIPALGSVPLNRLSADVGRSWVAEISATRAPATVAKALQLATAAIDAAVDDGILGVNHFTRVKAPRIERPELTIPSTGDVLAIADAAGPWAPLIFIAGFGGLRWGEVAGLTADRVDPLRRTVTVERVLREVRGQLDMGPPKTGSARRTVTLPRQVAESVAAHMAMNPPGHWRLVFTGPEGDPLRRTNWRRRVWLPATKAAGCPDVRFHDLRHHAASALLEAGEPIPVVAARIGHSSPAITLSIYSHVLDRGDQLAAEKLEAAIDANLPSGSLAALDLR